MKKILLVIVLAFSTSCIANQPVDKRLAPGAEIARLSAISTYLEKNPNYVSSRSSIVGIMRISDNLGLMSIKGNVNNFEVKRGGNGMGYSKKYTIKNIDNSVFGEIFVYHKRIAKIPSGIHNKIIRSEYKDYLNYFKSGSRAKYTNLRFISKNNIKIQIDKKSIKFNEIVIEAKDLQTNQNVISHAYLTGFSNNIMKVRITYPDSERTLGQEAVQKFLKDLAASLIGTKSENDRVNEVKNNVNYYQDIKIQRSKI